MPTAAEVKLWIVSATICEKYDIDERGKDDLILTVASMQAVGMLIGFFGCLLLVGVLMVAGVIHV